MLFENYEKCVVAFIDILGFSDWVDRADENEDTYYKIFDCLNQIAKSEDQRMHELTFPETQLRVQHFSDNVVLSCPLNSTSLFYLFTQVSNLTSDLLELGFLSRGGISIGKFCHTDRILFGAGLNQAYELETKVAKFPRIVIDEDSLSELRNLSEEKPSIMGLTNFTTFEDDIVFMDVIDDLFKYYSHQFLAREVNMHHHNPEVHLTEIRDAITERMTDTSLNQTVSEKYRWFIRLWNDRLSKNNLPKEYQM